MTIIERESTITGGKPYTKINNCLKQSLFWTAKLFFKASTNINGPFEMMDIMKWMSNPGNKGTHKWLLFSNIDYPIDAKHPDPFNEEGVSVD